MSTKAKLFEYAVIYHPTDKEEKKGEKSKIVIDPKTLLAATEHVATMQVIKKIPKEYDDRLEQLEIAIRPF
jgi:hypothetical protein